MSVSITVCKAYGSQTHRSRAIFFSLGFIPSETGDFTVISNRMVSFGGAFFFGVSLGFAASPSALLLPSPSLVAPSVLSWPVAVSVSVAVSDELAPAPKKDFSLPTQPAYSTMKKDTYTEKTRTGQGLILDLAVDDCVLYGDKATLIKQDIDLDHGVSCARFGQVLEGFGHTGDVSFVEVGRKATRCWQGRCEFPILESKDIRRLAS